MKVQIISCVFFFCLSLIGCQKLSGTDTGNPFNPNPDSGANPPDYSIGAALCTTVQKCLDPQVDLSSCESALLTDPNMTASLGLNTATYPTLSSVDQAVTNGTLILSTSNYDSCTNAIGDLDCGAIAAMSPPIYTSGSSDFSNVHELLETSTSCQEIYQ